ncbi:hypothetical protein MPTK1_3g15130 [Marchantia polymorpha subsp. ruderalis]|uniref:Uncharacterized protein n=2 Tax=Marchantia polymorpha TaxID=3197 RepID=A0AAF6B0Z7_MARPO|nr:hypothetical protein MARPO_0004s0159 [Marchantia polymorpha]BBN05681.1 hypothetical protein Mp_3g15130 [Marchantia polymorpha subsp. ruderalis]|eukprot:PTQ48900.1 hypothetical protein MARPO_0004s0159 [Marchantia polymorpha]
MSKLLCGPLICDQTRAMSGSRDILSNFSMHRPLFFSSYGLYSRSAPSRTLDCARSEPPKFRISSQAGRRHHRRRDMGFGAPQIKPKENENVDRVSYSRRDRGSDDKLVITLDMEELKQRAADRVLVAKRAAQRSVDKVVRVGKDFADEGVEAWRELRNSVRVQKDRRVVIAVKRSTINFAGKVLLWSVLGTVFVKFLIYAMREYRWGWDDSSRPRRAVRDRSLGGREVALGSGFKARERISGSRNTSSTRVFNPLDGIESSRSEKVLRSKRDRGTVTKTARLPGWWPASFMPPSPSIITRQKAEEKAHSLLQGIMQKRLIGYDFAFEDMIELRQLCKTAGMKVKFDTPNTRDTFYRAAINYVLLACCSDTGDASISDFGSEDGVSFIAGLASNIGLEDDRAATMVNAAVAARTRAGFLQVRALQLQEKFREADEELVKIIRMHSYFQPDSDSPEMELVARGIESQFNTEGKVELLKAYEKMGGNKTMRVAEEALGLHLSS